MQDSDGERGREPLDTRPPTSACRSQEGGNPEVVEVFDAVIVCSGHHWRPKTPAFPGLATFQGRQMHSHSYKDYKGFENLNVLVVGVGNSGGCPPSSTALALRCWPER